MRINNPLITLFCIGTLLAFSGQTAEFTPYGDALLRYENDSHHEQLKQRKRVRFIGHLGLKTTLDSPWFFDTRLSTGLKDKQNVPTITLVQFTQQSLPKRQVYFDRLYAGYDTEDLLVTFGKIPWLLKRNTDLFWDPDLHPLGVYTRYQLQSDLQLDAAIIKPLDGHSDTVGRLSYVSLTQSFNFDEFVFSFSPWVVDYQGQENAFFATRDTAFDNRSIRLSTTLKWDQWQVGIDYGYAFNDFDVDPEFDNEKTAWNALIKYGSLKHPGESEAYFRWLYVERFGVISELTQDSSSRFITSNYAGYEMRYRYKLNKNIWVGTRLSRTYTLVGDKEVGIRWRLEGQYKF